MLVSGRGEATVVFESGLGGPLEHWGKVQPAVSRFAKTVTYDRAGSGLSEEGPPPRHAGHVATELRDALRVAGIAPPYVLVGASLGGAYIRVFAGLYPADVAGMVLVDPTPTTERFRELLDAERERDALVLPEVESLPGTLEHAHVSRVPDGIPLVLIDAVSPVEIPFATGSIRALRAESRQAIEIESREYRQWLDGIRGSRLVVTRGSGHDVAQEQPDLVVSTIRGVVEEVTGRQPRQR